MLCVTLQRSNICKNCFVNEYNIEYMNIYEYKKSFCVFSFFGNNPIIPITETYFVLYNKFYLILNDMKAMIKVKMIIMQQ